jgi:hypothetical protein
MASPRIRLVAGLTHLEHDAVGVGLAAGEGDVGVAQEPQTLARIRGGPERLLLAGGEAGVARGAYGVEDLVLVAEIAVGRHGRHAELLRQPAQRDAGVAERREAPGGDLAKLLPEGGDGFAGEGGARHDVMCTA